MTATNGLDRDLSNLVHYLQPALDDLRNLDLPFETYMLEMVVLALKDRPPVRTNGAGRFARLPA